MIDRKTEKYISSTMLRCQKMLSIYDRDAQVHLEISTAGAACSYFLFAESTMLAKGRRKSRTVGGIADTLKEAEHLFYQGLVLLVKDMKFQVTPALQKRAR